MEIKQIRLSPKRGGNGFISSYSVNIGAREARDCFHFDGELSHPLVKVLDPEHGQIILRLKQFTLTPQLIGEVCRFAEQSRDLHRRLAQDPPKLDPEAGVYRSSDTALQQQIDAHDSAYYSYLLALPQEALTDLVTLMCMGRDRDVDRSLPSMQRFLRYWQLMEQYGSFTLGSDALAGQLMYNLELAEYLRAGLALMEQT